MNNSNNYLNSLNQEQLEAVLYLQGPLLVLAGAGTGKTKVLTTRIAHIIATNSALPGQILAVTFTNKAANAMKSRIANFIGNIVDGMWVSTFHAIAAKILRQNAEKLGFTPNFIIIDKEDQLRLARQILDDYNIDEKSNPAKLMLYMIERFKDKGWNPEKITVSEVARFADGKISELYHEYQRRLKQLNAVDFGDLLLHNITLFNQYPDVCQFYQNKFKYILVDEYQDTNIAQYLWIRMLAQSHHNICCVGDDDQSIYGWRGAEVTNILRFDSTFANAKIIRLERNYRSTEHILQAATQIITNNKSRHGKILWTEQSGGEKIKLNSFYDDKQEASFIADEIDILQRLHKKNLTNIAVLVRASYQTRGLEESLNFLRIPYRIIGGTKFYERLEIKDVLGYIRLLVNSEDSLAFERIINTPKRGIGEATLQQIYITAKEYNFSLYKAAEKLVSENCFKAKVSQVLADLLNKFAKWRDLLYTMPHVEVIEILLNESGYKEMWKLQDSEDAKDRLDNIKELLQGISEFSDLNEYLEHISLINDADSIADDNKVNIMTMHAAKGLEFDIVFLPGWEEGVFPSSRAITDINMHAIEEERRLAYVAITRAKHQLYISYAHNRNTYGSYQATQISRFIDEIPQQAYEVINNFQSRYRIVMQERKKPDSHTIEKALENPGSKKFKYGQRITHAEFGSGIVLAVIDNTVQVMFDSIGLKKISINYLESSN